MSRDRPKPGKSQRASSRVACVAKSQCRINNINNDSCDRALIDRGEQRTTGSSGHASAWRSLCSFSTWRLRNCNCSKRRRACPGAQKARTACGRGPARGTTPCHGAPGATSGNSAARRAGVPSGATVTASGYGAASDAANRCTATPCHAEFRCTHAPERPATGADRSARAAHSTVRSATAAEPAGAAARHVFTPRRAASGAERSVGADRAAAVPA